MELGFVGVKAPQFSFTRLEGAEPTVGVEMASTGEVGCLGRTLEEAYLKALMAVGHGMPPERVLVSLRGTRSCAGMVRGLRGMADAGVELWADRETHSFMAAMGVAALPLPECPHDPDARGYEVMDKVRFELLISLRDGRDGEGAGDCGLRRAAADRGIPVMTDLRGAGLLCRALSTSPPPELEAGAWDEYPRPQNRWPDRTGGPVRRA
jgi:carbamoyl-phosphate synthase large subunit